MSASTVSVAANPRRRSAAISDVKQSIEIVNDGVYSPTAIAGDGGRGADKVASGGNKDLSHSIRGEAVVEGSKEKRLPQNPNSNAAVRTRTRKAGVQKVPKPRWVMVLSVLAKNLLVLLVLAGFVQMCRNYVVNSGSVGSSSSGSLLGFSDMEGRIAGVESSLKTTTKMLQVQVEMVDKKIESEVGNMRREVSRKIEDKIGEIGVQLRRLEEKGESLEMGLTELKSKGVLTKNDVLKLYEELKRDEGGESVRVSFDEIRGLAREIVEKEIEKHAADGLGRVDYAVASGGAKVVSHSKSLARAGHWFPGRNKFGIDDLAVKMLSPSFGEPGACFPLNGTSGFVVIRLRTPIVPEAITLEHVAKSVAFDQSSAPKHCRVTGWFQGVVGYDVTETGEKEIFHLTDFVYDLEKSTAQTFNVLEGARSSVIDSVRFEFSSNHGNPLYTCIYRLRVHGHESESVPMIPADS